MPSLLPIFHLQAKTSKNLLLGVLIRLDQVILAISGNSQSPLSFTSHLYKDRQVAARNTCCSQCGNCESKSPCMRQVIQDRDIVHKRSFVA